MANKYRGIVRIYQETFFYCVVYKNSWTKGKIPARVIAIQSQSIQRYWFRNVFFGWFMCILFWVVIVFVGGRGCLKRFASPI